MNKGLRLRCLRWAFAVGTAWLAAGCSPGVPDVLKIGVAVNTSGTGGIRGQDLLNGAQLAAAELNSSGFKVDGRVVRVEIVAKDDEGDAQTAKQVAEGLMAEQVHAVIGHVNTRETQAALPVYAARGVPHLFSSTLKTLTSMGSGNTLRLVANDAVQARALASFATENLKAQRLVAVVETGSYGKGLFDDMVASLPPGKTVLERFEVDVTSPVADTTANRIKALGADVVVVIGRELQVTSLVEKLSALDHINVSVLAVNPAKTTKVAATPMRVNALYVTATTMDAAELGHGKEFLAAFGAKFNSEPVWGAHYAYDAVHIVAHAMRTTRSVDPKRLIAELKNNEPQAKVLHQLRFDDNGEQKYPSIGIYRREGNTWVPHVRSSAW
jgi:branched-chain amino acid transport system substrate-binding protein